LEFRYGRRILVFIATWKRAHITEICLQILLNNIPVNWRVEIFLLVSDKENEKIANKYQTGICYCKNKPLGAKMNRGLKYAMGYDFEYLLQLNSDAIVTEKFFDLMETGCEQKQSIFGLGEMWYLQLPDQAKFVEHTEDEIFGSGRVISRKVLEQVKKPWINEKNYGLDMSSNLNFRKAGYKIKSYNPNQPLLLDLKTDTNIWSFDKVGGRPVTMKSATKNIKYDDLCRLGLGTEKLV
jgi:glycosyltransferase involved in cell wall biosynthesis